MKVNLYLKSALYFIISLLSLLLIINIFYYFDIIGNNLIKYLKAFSILFSCFLSGIVAGFKSLNKGYLTGIKFSGIIIAIFFLISIILKSFSLKSVVYYLIIMLTTTLGAMFGINRKKND